MELIEELKKNHLISLYGERVMFYDEGYGEIKYMKLEKTPLGYHLESPFLKMEFADYELTYRDDGSPDTLVANGCEFKFPRKKRLIESHNVFYPEEFLTSMEEALKANMEKGDWLDKDFKTILAGLKVNLGKVKASATKDDVRKSCVDIANYAMMIHYIFEEKEKKNETT